MKQDLRVPSRDLLTCFFKECEKQFRFLEENHGYTYLSGLTEYRQNYKIIVPYNTQKVEEPFLGLTRYEKGDHAVEILYGDDDYILEMFIYINATMRFNLYDLMLAARRDVLFEQNPSWVTQDTRIHDLVRHFAKSMRADSALFLTPSDRLVNRALTMRSKIMEQSIRAHLKKSVETATHKAAQAFVQKDFKQVIEILEPFQEHLGSADIKKLKLAKQQLKS